MGDYATTTSLSKLLPGYLRGDTTTSDSSATDIFSAQITRAESVVNASVGRKYSLPFSSVPPIIRTLSEDIACYYALRGVFNQDGKTINPYLAEYKNALKTLDMIAEGTMPLTYTDGSEVPAGSDNLFMSSSKDYRPIFGLDDPVNWRRDPDEVRQTESDREEV